MAGFVERLETTVAPDGGVALFWLEQSHFIVKTHAGAIVHVDPFLSRVVKPENHIHPEPPMAPDAAPADAVLLTHDHRDHTDPHTIGPLAAANPACEFVGSAESCRRCRSVGVEPVRCHPVAVGDSLTLSPSTPPPPAAPIAVRVMPAQNTSARDETAHLGYLLEVGAVRLYFVGDTRRDPYEYSDHIAPTRGLRPDVMCVPINEKYNNPGPDGAAWLLDWVEPRMVVPCHYDCFKDNTIDPRRFVEALAPERRDAARVLERGECLMICAA